VVTDLRMPELDGFGVLAAVKERALGTEVIILTGSYEGDIKAAVRALRLGAHDYLTKLPQSRDEMVLAVERAVEKKRLRDSNLRLLRELEKLSRTDALTGLLNRRSFDEALRAEAVRCQRYGVPLALGVVDLDHFKRINDEHGHQGGDSVLRHFAALARAAFRTSDSVYRYGGEEFAILLPHTDLVGGLEVVERLRHELEAKPVPLGPSTAINVTCSGGVALLQPGDHEGSLLLSRADGALYAAKAAGRNRIHAAGRPSLKVARSV